MNQIQDSRIVMVTYTCRICSEMKKCRCPTECATEQISTLFSLYSKRRKVFFSWNIIQNFWEYNNQVSISIRHIK